MSHDIIIVGTGASSLLLARSLLARHPGHRLRLVGPRRPMRPHLLSFWADEPTPFDSFVESSWKQLSIFGARGVTVTAPLTRYRYCTMRAERWAQAVRAELTASGRVEWVEAMVDGFDDRLDGASVHCAGRRLDADWVFSSAPLVAAPDAWQRFLGWEVLVREPSFNVSTATWLDFRTPAEGDFRFVYALPLTANRVFVEHVSSRPCDHQSALEAYLRDVLKLSSWEVVDREGGATPLFKVPPRRGACRVVHIGVLGGLAKACTGFALMRMWRDAERIATRLNSGKHPVVEFRWPSLFEVADRYFMGSLSSAPTTIESLLTALFSKAPADAVLSFLDERAGLGEQLSVAGAMPEWLKWSATRMLEHSERA